MATFYYLASIKGSSTSPSFAFSRTSHCQSYAAQQNKRWKNAAELVSVFLDTLSKLNAAGKHIEVISA